VNTRSDNGRTDHVGRRRLQNMAATVSRLSDGRCYWDWTTTCGL
jgi:hypothetical protein